MPAQPQQARQRPGGTGRQVDTQCQRQPSAADALVQRRGFRAGTGILPGDSGPHELALPIDEHVGANLAAQADGRDSLGGHVPVLERLSRGLRHTLPPIVRQLLGQAIWPADD